jgi:6-phosphofructokinase 1
VETDPATLTFDLRTAYERGKAHAIVVVAEGTRYNAEALTSYFREHCDRLGFELRVIKLGHVQRGGRRGVFDRLLATRMGATATEHIARDDFGVLVELINNDIAATHLANVVGKRKVPDLRFLKLACRLAK